MNSGDGQEKVKDETEKEVEKWDATLDGIWDFEMDNPIKEPYLDPTRLCHHHPASNCQPGELQKHDWLP